VPPGLVSVRRCLNGCRKGSSSRFDSVSIRVPPRPLQLRGELPGVAEPRRACQHAGHMGRSKATFDLPADLLDELRVASVMLPREAVGASLSALAEGALRRELQRLRDEFNRGKPFPTPSKIRARKA
jgi:hypothetical protein